MLGGKRSDGEKSRWQRLLIFCVLLVIAGSANARVPDKRTSQRAQRQGLQLEERIETEQLLSKLGYWTGPVDLADCEFNNR